MLEVWVGVWTKSMMGTEKLLLMADDYLKDKVDYMVFASSLLGIIREGHLLKHDKEVDICVHGEDLTDKLISTMESDGLLFFPLRAKEKYPEMYLSFSGVVGEIGIKVAFNPLWTKYDSFYKKEICYQNPTDDDCIVWKTEDYPKKTWSKIKYLGREFKAPHNPEEWLEYYYGESWRTPIAGSWWDNKNLRKWEDLCH